MKDAPYMGWGNGKLENREPLLGPECRKQLSPGVGNPTDKPNGK